MNRRRQIATISLLLLAFGSACGSDGGGGIWPFGKENATSSREVELYAEFGEPGTTMGAIDPGRVEFAPLGEGTARPDAVARVKPADEKMQPIEGLPRTRIPLFFWNAGFIKKDLQFSKAQRQIFFRDGLALRAGLFEASGQFDSGADANRRTFRVEEFALRACRSARAAKLQLFPGADHLCIWFGGKRCEIGGYESTWFGLDEKDPAVPAGYDLSRHYRVRFRTRCPNDRPVALTFFVQLTGPERGGSPCERKKFRPEARADGECPPDWVKVDCGAGDDNRTEFFKGLEGYLSVRHTGDESSYGFRAMSARLTPGPKRRGLQQCPSGPLRVWGTVDKSAPIVAPVIPDTEDGGSNLGY